MKATCHYIFICDVVCRMKEGDICYISILWTSHWAAGPSLMVYRGAYHFDNTLLLRFSYPDFTRIEYCIYPTCVRLHANFTQSLKLKTYWLASYRSRKRMHLIREELVQRTWHPSRLVQTGALDEDMFG
jgi:hypothetical protein